VQKFNSIIDYLLVAIGLIVTLIMSAQIFCRYVLNESIPWSEEVVRYLFIWMTFLGAAIVLREKQQIRVTYFLDLLPNKVRDRVKDIESLLTRSLILVLAILGLIWLMTSNVAISSSTGAPVNMIIYSALPVTMILSIIFLMTNRGDKKK